MPKIASIQTNFTGGELSPRLAGRVDIARYQNGVSRMENFHPVVQGGAKSRPGTDYRGAARGDGRLIPFVYNRVQSYVLELTDQALRIWRSDGSRVLSGGSPLELVTPYTLAQLPDVRWEQSDDTCFFFHEAYAPRWLRRNGDAAWVFEQVPWVAQPFAELSASPAAFVYPTAKEPIGAVVELRAALPRAATLTIAGTAGVGNTLTLGADAAVFSAGDVGLRVYADSGVARITAVGSSTNASAVQESTAAFLSTSYPQGAWGATGAAWSAGDVDKYVRINSGLVRITSVPSAEVALGEIRTSLSAMVASPPGGWELCEAVWTAGRGYPRAGCLHEQRLWCAGTAAEPTALWSSRIGEYLNFELGTKDDDAFTYALAMKRRDPVQHLAAGRRLFVLTQGAEVSMRGGQEKAIGPTNVQRALESPHGAAAVRPVEVGGELLFVQGAGRKVRAMGYDLNQDGYSSPDRTALAEHVTGAGVVDMAYQAEPDSLLYCVRTDGEMAVCAYDVAQEVVGWSRWITDGEFRSACAVPMAARDDVWVLVHRPWGYTVERFGADRQTDAGVIATAGTPTATWGGLSHLEGRDVQVLADGTYQGTQTVTGGQITLAREASAVEAGLPFRGELSLLPPEASGGTGTAQGSNMSVNEVVVRLLDTDVLTINGETSDFRSFGSSLLDRPPPGYTGDMRAISLSDSLYLPRVVITRELPFKAHVLAVIRKLTINDV